MQFLSSILFTVQILSALAMIGLILVQHGKGADAGAAFGSGSSGSLFGASGSANFLSRSTAVLAAVFFVATLGLAYTSGVRPSSSGDAVLDKLGNAAPAATSTAPAAASSAASAPSAQAIPVAPAAAPASAPATAAPAAASSAAAAATPTK